MPIEGTFGAGEQGAILSGSFVAHVAQSCSPVSIPHAEEIEGLLCIALFCRPVEIAVVSVDCCVQEEDDGDSILCLGCRRYNFLILAVGPGLDAFEIVPQSLR